MGLHADLFRSGTSAPQLAQALGMAWKKVVTVLRSLLAWLQPLTFQQHGICAERDHPVRCDGLHKTSCVGMSGRRQRNS